MTDFYVPAISPLRRLRSRANAWVRGRLWLQVVVGLVAGVLTALLLGPELSLVSRDTATTATAWMALPGKLFLSLIAMVLVPLVVASIIHGLCATTDPARLRSIGVRFGSYVVATTTAAACLGATLALAIRPGALIDLTDAAPATTSGSAMAAPAASNVDVANLTGRMPDLLAGLVPQNVTRSILEDDMLAIVIFAILVGIACVTANRARIEPFLRLLASILEVSVTVVKWAMFLAPWAVFGLMAPLVARSALARCSAWAPTC